MIHLRDDANEAIRRIADRAVRDIPEAIPKDDIMKARLELIKHLKRLTKHARDAKALSLYLPVERVHGMLVPASFVVSEVLPGPGVGVDPNNVLGLLGSGAANSESVTVDSAEGIRADDVVPPAPEKDIEHASRRIDYILPVPDSAAPQWVTVSFSTIADGQPQSEFAEILVELFDAVMTTFRWSRK